MIGDILHDVEAGKKAGCKTILINNGNETEWDISDLRKPTVMAGNIDQAADFILQSNDA
jgi:phosphoglycolate phosphatase-like HAD superfamily hydrolase